jgi:hypothetical protein
MSRATMAAALPGRNTLFGIGRYADLDRKVDFEIGWPEHERDVLWAARVLETWGLGASDHVLYTLPNCEGPWSSHVIQAVRNLGATYSNAEPYGWDARRCATFLRLLPIKALIGISGETVTALQEQEQLELLSPLSLIWARPEAIEPLRAAGLAPAAWVMLGPALALECPARSGAHLDPDEWSISDGPDGLTLSTVGQRQHLATAIRLGPGGGIDESPCTCGLPGPRVTPIPSVQGDQR